MAGICEMPLSGALETVELKHGGPFAWFISSASPRRMTAIIC